MDRKSATTSMLAVGLAGSMLLGLSTATSAQTPPAGRPATPPEVMEPPTESTTPPPDTSTEGDKPKEPLSKQLDEGEGVLDPPRGIDPEMKKPVPEGFNSKTPVIPPPGSAGGDPSVEPK